MLGVCLAFTGCEDDVDSTERGSPSASGSWSFVDPQGNQETMNLTQSGNQVSGSTDRGGNASGTTDGMSYSISIEYANSYTLNLDTTISGDTMTGTVSDSSGGSGDFVAVRPDDSGGDDSGDATGGSRTWRSNRMHTNLAGDPVELSVTVSDNGAVSIVGTHWNLSAVPMWNDGDTVFSAGAFSYIHLRDDGAGDLYVNIHGPELYNSFEDYLHR